MVAPPGEHTLSFRMAGCVPVSTTILAAPNTVWAAIYWAMALGSPCLTPPSASASMNMKTYAGPLPLSPDTASSRFSLTSKEIPHESMKSFTVAESSGDAL